MGKRDGLPPPPSRRGRGGVGGARKGAGAARTGPSYPALAREPAGRPVRVSGRESVRHGDQAGAAHGSDAGATRAAGEGAGWLFPCHQPSRRGAPCPARPSPALPSARPPPARPGIPCGGMWLLAGPGGTQLAGGREGGARGAGGSERPGGVAGGGPLGGIPAPLAGSAPTRAWGRRTGVWCG